MRLMTENDLAAVDELRRIAGWRQTLEDWRRLLSLEPEGCFVTTQKDTAIGTVTTTRYGTELAWIGMMLVHPEHRRKGIATQLMKGALEYLRTGGVQCVKLDATPAGRPLYEKLGFQAESSLTRWQREAAAQPITSRASNDHIRDLREADWPVIEQIDAAAFGVRRPQLLRSLAQTSRRLSVLCTDGRISSWGLLRRGAQADYLGPLECSNEEDLLPLTSELLGYTTAGTTIWDIPDENRLARQIAEQFGFHPVRPLTRMYLGSLVSARAPESLCGIADPAVG